MKNIDLWIGDKQVFNKLDLELRESLRSIPESKRVLVTCEGAFSYLAKDYGLEEKSVYGENSRATSRPLTQV